MNVNYGRFNPYMISSGYMSINENPVPGTIFPIRIVRWYEFELIHKSNKGYVVSCDHRIEAEKGVLMIRKPSTVVRGVSSYECNSVIFDSQYDPEMMCYYKEMQYDDPTSDLLVKMKAKRLDFLETLPDYIEVTDYSYFKNLFEQGLDLYLRHNEDVEFYGKLIIYNILGAILEEISLKESRNLKIHNQNAYEVVSLTKQYIDNEYNEPITLSQLAKKAGYSKEAYCRLFKRTYGKSPIEYLINIRLFYAKKILLTTKRSIYDIALSCGFNNDTYFYTVFMKKEGMSPNKYRKSHKLL